jgi:hypothetical protein
MLDFHQLNNYQLVESFCGVLFNILGVETVAHHPARWLQKQGET